MSLFGYTNPDFINRYPKEKKDEYYQVGYSVPWLQSMENFKETKEIFGEYPKVNKTVIPDEFKDFTIYDVAANFQPMARLNNSFYNNHNLKNNFYRTHNSNNNCKHNTNNMNCFKNKSNFNYNNNSNSKNSNNNNNNSNNNLNNSKMNSKKTHKK